MDPVSDKDWKQTVGFTINYHSDQSSGDDFDAGDVVVRRSASRLLEDADDGAPADLLGTTPPRARLRDKEKRRNIIIESEMGLRKALKDNRRNTVANFNAPGEHTDMPERKKRSSLKSTRARGRDLKLDINGKEYRSDSLPSPAAGMPTLVESCSRFMSLSSRLKCMTPAGAGPRAEGDQPFPPAPQTLPPAPQSRLDFHRTFSLLINMGSVEKGCRRTISREEQVWQNELKDLIWLELQARLAGRSLPQHDAWLCSERGGVPQLLRNICQYRFVSNNPCRTAGHEEAGSDDVDGCLSFSCEPCADNIGRALREVGILLDSYYNALALYPSSKAMTLDHPLVATQLFNNRLKALCLWYNMVLNLRSRLLGVRAHLRALLSTRARYAHALSRDSDADSSTRQSDNLCRVRFNLNCTPTDSNNSDSSSHSEQAPPTPAPHSDTLTANSDTHADDSDTRTAQSDTKADESDTCATKCDSKAEYENKVDQSDTKAAEFDIKVNESNTKAAKAETASSMSESDAPGLRARQFEGQSMRDEVDNAKERIECLTDTSCPSTPEILLPTAASSESGYASERSERSDGESDVYSMGSLDDLTELCLLGHCEVSPYRYYLSDILKTQGVRRSMMFIQKLRQHILQKVYLAFEKPDDESTPESDRDGSSPAPAQTDGVFADAAVADPDSALSQQQAYELRRYGSWSAECQAMRLPSYRSHFLLLSTLTLEVVHAYLALRLSARPARPSCLTVKQMIHELKEGIDLATEMRVAYVRHLRAALLGYRAAPRTRRSLRLALHTFDNTVRDVLQQYLSYLTTLSEGKFMSRSQLEAEWNFTSRLATRTHCVAELAPQSFTDIVCNQIDRVLNEFQTRFEEYFKGKEQDITGTEDLEVQRQLMYALCREAQLFHTAARERTLHAVKAARALAARLLRAPPPAFIHLRDTLFQRLLRARAGIVRANMQLIARGAGALDRGDALGEGLSSRLRELLLQVFRLGFELHMELYSYVCQPARVTSHARARPVSLQPPRAALPPPRRRPETVIVHESVNPLLHKELHRFVKDPVRGYSPVPSAPRPRLAREESVIDVPDEELFDGKCQQKQSSIELLLSEGEGTTSPPSPAQPPPAPAPEQQWTQQTCATIEQQWTQQVARAIIEFAQCWMRFVTQRCERGRGLRPRWANQGLEFLMLACDPCNTKHISDSEFEELKQLMDQCISHVIGSRAVRTPEPTPAPPRRPRPRIHSPMSTGPCPPADGACTGAGEPPLPPAPPAQPDPLAAFNCVDTAAHRSRVLAATAALDLGRDAALRARGAVGRLLPAVTRYEPKLRQVTFKWQRGLKIGAGTFGKVYTVINTETSQLLAMKELAICANDRRSLQRAANELQVLEGVIHPHLVRYYGCELHREEMLIFMELCVEGSLEALLATTGALPEHATRKYSKQLVSALAELHARAIAHRDVKSGNIFLTNEGHCLKLGDFGCAVKIRANTTAAGELQGTVGTQAYMAPEVFMKSSGHGRAADIWSLGCVVTEMASGKRPWSEYDSNYQIMFVVGMGGRPAIPASLSEEGRDLCLQCLTHEPDARPKATDLAQHHFLMVKADEDCNCQPGYLITKAPEVLA